MQALSPGVSKDCRGEGEPGDAGPGPTMEGFNQCGDFHGAWTSSEPRRDIAPFSGTSVCTCSAVSVKTRWRANPWLLQGWSPRRGEAERRHQRISDGPSAGGLPRAGRRWMPEVAPHSLRWPGAVSRRDDRRCSASRGVLLRSEGAARPQSKSVPRVLAPHGIALALPYHRPKEEPRDRVSRRTGQAQSLRESAEEAARMRSQSLKERPPTFSATTPRSRACTRTATTANGSPPIRSVATTCWCSPRSRMQHTPGSARRPRRRNRTRRTDRPPPCSRCRGFHPGSRLPRIEPLINPHPFLLHAERSDLFLAKKILEQCPLDKCMRLSSPWSPSASLTAPVAFKVLAIWSSISMRSVATTNVQPPATLRSTSCTKNTIERLLRLPCVCQNTPR